MYSTVQYSTVQYSTVQYSTVRAYMPALALIRVNRDKTQYMVLNRDPPLKSKVRIPAHPEDIIPKESLIFLGVNLSEKLNWKTFLTDGRANLYNQLKARVSAVKKLHTNCSFNFAHNLASVLFVGKTKLCSRALGGGGTTVHSKIFQSLQLEVVCTVIGPKSFMWSKSSLLSKMGWMSIQQLLDFTSNKLTYKILY